jgi:hypothetical protein
MNRFLNLARRFRFAAYAAACWLAVGALALAQAGGAGEKTEAEAPPYVVPYALVILCIGLGLAVVLNSSKRRDRAKPEVYGEPK